ncbi:MAG: hypothetical protein HKN54_01260 [Flavobacteriaceae bacterium]|nr:hypothetical protein [Flavobacteriaceae bacterium]
MCTVTFVPLNETNFVLTSNRDEAPNRLSLAPDFDEINQVKILYPKDEISGGTWIGASEKNRVLCILNGGFGWHERQVKYRHSRGIIVKDLLVSENLQKSVSRYDLERIEPFTLVMVDWIDSLRCYELIWDGIAKHFNELAVEPMIWSSSTLYTEAMKNERVQWFDAFKKEQDLTPATLLNFHKVAGKGNLDYGIIMDRGFVKTTSITQIRKEYNKLDMHFFDLVNAKDSSTTLTTLQLLNE